MRVIFAGVAVLKGAGFGVCDGSSFYSCLSANTSSLRCFKL
uniref:Uncharacterized protein n=1 Tax=Anguilla anguilla TaxID=7936 RepID=A0A0E9WG34_ANGAN